MDSWARFLGALFGEVELTVEGRDKVSSWRALTLAFWASSSSGLFKVFLGCCGAEFLAFAFADSRFILIAASAIFDSRSFQESSLVSGSAGVSGAPENALGTSYCSSTLARVLAGTGADLVEISTVSYSSSWSREMEDMAESRGFLELSLWDSSSEEENEFW